MHKVQRNKSTDQCLIENATAILSISLIRLDDEMYNTIIKILLVFIYNKIKRWLDYWGRGVLQVESAVQRSCA